MSADSDGFATLTARNGCKCIPDDSITVEDCLTAVSSEIGARNILSASRMNKAVVVFLKEESMVHHLVEVGLSVGDVFLPVLPLSSPSKKVTLSNVPPFISNDSLERLLGRYGKILMPIKMIPLGVKNPNLKHVMSFRRQTFMILNAEFQNLDVSVKLTLSGKDYKIFISSDSMKCFSCGIFGHTRQNCPSNKVNEQNVNEPNILLEQEALTLENVNQDVTLGNKTDLAVSDSLSKDEENPKEHAATSCAGDAEKCLVNTSECDNVSGGAEIAAAGISDPERPRESGELADVGESRDSRASVGLSLSGKEQLTGRGDTQSENIDYDSEESDIVDDLTDVSSQGSYVEKQCSLQKKPPYYTVQQINTFLDSTFNQRRPRLEKYFSDLQLFVDSCAMAMRKASLEELDQPKRYRLKKHVSAVKKRLKICSKKY